MKRDASVLLAIKCFGTQAVVFYLHHSNSFQKKSGRGNVDFARFSWVGQLQFQSEKYFPQHQQFPLESAILNIAAVLKSAILSKVSLQSLQYFAIFFTTLHVCNSSILQTQYRSWPSHDQSSRLRNWCRPIWLRMGFSDLLTESPAFPFATTFRSGFSGSIEKGPFSTHRLLHVWVQILFFVETENLFFRIRCSPHSATGYGGI